MSDVALVAFLSILFQTLVFVVQKLYDRRTQKIQQVKGVSEIVNIDSETFERLTSALDRLTNDYLESNAKVLQSVKEIERVEETTKSNKIEIDFLNNRMSLLDAENLQLKQKNVVFESAIFELQKENFALKKESVTLRHMVEYERNEGLKLRSGIDKLINQLRSVPLSPIWEPPTTPLEEIK